MTDIKDAEFLGSSTTENKFPAINFAIFDCVNERKEQLSISLKDLNTPRKLQELIFINNGICEDPDEICNALLKAYNTNLRNKQYPIVKQHEVIGWRENKKSGIPEYCGFNIVSADDTVQSQYSGDVDIKPQGSIDAVVDLIKTEIIQPQEADWCKLEAVLCASVGSLMLAFSNMFWETDMDNVILHLMGNSSTGKSTALSMFASIASNPAKKRGYWMTFASTQGALIKRIGNNMGLPVVIDELSGVKKKDLESLVYNVGNGEEAERLKGAGAGRQESVAFQTVIMSSGEVSLLKKCSKLVGLRARCFEFSNEQWTISKSQSVNIKACLRNNHGLIAPLIAKSLITESDRWRKLLEYYRTQVEKDMEDRGITCSIKDRIAEYVALFSLAGEVLNDTLDVQLNLEEIYKFFFMHIIVANDDEANMAKNAYYAIMQHVSEHRELFEDATYTGGSRSMYNTINLDSDKEGFIIGTRKHVVEGKIYDRVIVFRMGTIENVLSDAGFSETKVALYELRKNSLIKTKDSKRNTYPYVINGTQVNCVAVYYEDTGAEIQDIDD